MNVIIIQTEKAEIINVLSLPIQACLIFLTIKIKLRSQHIVPFCAKSGNKKKVVRKILLQTGVYFNSDLQAEAGPPERV